jgi:hypothetical protein
MTIPHPTQPAATAAGVTRRRFETGPWVVALVAAAVILAGFLGWTLAKVRSGGESGHEQSQTTAQAKAQACNAFTVSGRRWLDAYREWLPSVAAPDWSWADPAVQAATVKFTAVEVDVASQLNGFISPNTPTDVAQAVHGYTGALLEYAAAHLLAKPSQMESLETAINDAADDVTRVCSGAATAP